MATIMVALVFPKEMSMLKPRGAALAAALALIVLAGCGGGGGQPSPVTPPLSGEKTVTGKVVSSVDKTTGVPGVLITFSGAYAITDSTGAFRLTFNPLVTELDYFFAVDTSGAGTSYPTTELVELTDGQTYYPGAVDMPVAVLNGDQTTLATIIVRQVAGQNPPGPPYPSHDSYVYGRLIQYSDGAAISGATIRLGQPSAPVLTTTTGANGYFAFPLGRDAMLVDVVGTARMFSVDLSTATGSYSLTWLITYGTSADPYYQLQAITIPSNTETIGLVKATESSSGGGGTEPPPPPF